MIISHKKEITQIKQAISTNNIPHAYIFAGISGIGKRMVANYFAKILLCNEPASLTNSKNSECNQCKNCEMFEAGSHPDIIVIEPEKDKITIDRIRTIKEKMKFAPYQASKRVIIIDSADTMNTNAENAALKILEEPPPNNHFFLITETPHRLLPTILSRCQRLDFSPIASRDIASFLITEKNYTEEDAIKSAYLSQGSIGRALLINPELVDEIGNDITSIIEKRSASLVLEAANKWASYKDDLPNILYIIHNYFLSALKSKTSQINADHFSTQKITAANSMSKLIDKCNLINKYHYLSTTTVNKQLMFEELLFTLAA